MGQDHIVVDDDIADQANFALRVTGDSMIETAILDIDIVLMGEPLVANRARALIREEVR